jgi:dipeptidase E
MAASAPTRLLLLSSSRVAGLGYLEYARASIAEFLGSGVKRVLFVPFAIVTKSYDDYLEMVRAPFREIGVEVEGLHRADRAEEAVGSAGAIVVGGGNTWRLVRELRLRDLMDPIRQAVRRGVAYVGWSAGANIACPTFQTTNDMPICDPLAFETLGLVPFQINPHYLHGNPPGFHGETREDRIREYLEMHPGVVVVGLREGTLLRVEPGQIRLVGGETCRVFRRGEEPRELGALDDLQFLLQAPGS